MVKLFKQESDDNKFIETIETIIYGALKHYSANIFFLIKIDNWFGKRWCGFSHKVMGAFGVSL